MNKDKDDFSKANIVRVRKDARYFVASNIPFNDQRLSWEARGVMGYLLSKPDDWQVWINDLVRKGPAGIRIIKRVMAELRHAGYMSRQKIRKTDGTFTWITTIYETPELNHSAIDTKVIDGSTIGTKTIDGSSIDGERIDIAITDLQNTESDRYKDAVAQKLSDCKFQFNPKSGSFIQIWKQDFPDDVICRAIDQSAARGANSIAYVDKILIGWKANGVPPTREEQIKNAKAARPSSTSKKMSLDDFNSSLARAVENYQEME